MSNVLTIRQKILEQAMCGELVPQNENDEDVSLLLNRIQREKQTLVEQKIMKKQTPLPPIEESEIPYAIPKGWAWVRLRDIVELLNGRAYKKQELLDEGKTPVLRVGNFFTNQSWYYSDLDLDENKYCDNGDLLYAWSASFGPKIWDGGRVIYHYHIWKVNIFGDVNKKYLYYLLLKDVNDIKSITTGSTMVHVTKENMEKRLFPLPPLEEQTRIVEEIEGLFSLCDQLENEVENQEKSIQILHDKVLEDALNGLLVDQKEDDEPATVLFEKIRIKKEQLIKEKKLKNSKSLPPIVEEEILQELPLGWTWVRIGDIAQINPRNAIDVTEHIIPDSLFHFNPGGNLK